MRSSSGAEDLPKPELVTCVTSDKHGIHNHLSYRTREARLSDQDRDTIILEDRSFFPPCTWLRGQSYKVITQLCCMMISRTAAKLTIANSLQICVHLRVWITGRLADLLVCRRSSSYDRVVFQTIFRFPSIGKSPAYTVCLSHFFSSRAQSWF